MFVYRLAIPPVLFLLILFTYFLSVDILDSTSLCETAIYFSGYWASPPLIHWMPIMAPSPRDNQKYHHIFLKRLERRKHPWIDHSGFLHLSKLLICACDSMELWLKIWEIVWGFLKKSFLCLWKRAHVYMLDNLSP